MEALVERNSRLQSGDFLIVGKKVIMEKATYLDELSQDGKIKVKNV